MEGFGGSDTAREAEDGKRGGGRKLLATCLKGTQLPDFKDRKKRDCSIATGADSKIARQEQGESTWDPLNASELAPNSANGLIPSLIAWAKSQPPGNVAIVSEKPGKNRPSAEIVE